MPINNHCVLLRGVNDTVEIQRRLCRELLRSKVRPYYLFHCDPVTGAGHFRTSIWRGIEIIEGLRGHISGLGVPTYVVDATGGGGKIPLSPQYLVSTSDDAVVLRNYEGMLVRYQPTDEPRRQAQTLASQGVSALLSSGEEVLMPENNPRIARRRKSKSLAEFGDLADGNGHARVDDNGHAHANGKAGKNGTANGKTAAQSNGRAVAPTLTASAEDKIQAQDHALTARTARGRKRS